MFATCKYIRTLSKIFSASSSKVIKTFLINGLCCHIASYNVQHVTNGKPVKSYFTSTDDKIHHGQSIGLFSCAASVVFLAMIEVS